MNHEPCPSASRKTCIVIIALKLLQFPYLITLEKEDREISWSKSQYYIMHNSSSLGNRRGPFYLKVGRGAEQAKRGKGSVSFSPFACPQDFLRRPKRHWKSPNSFQGFSPTRLWSERDGSRKRTWERGWKASGRWCSTSEEDNLFWRFS